MDRFGDALPFLVKVLAADEPLSLQAHPSTEQAVEGFAREERMGIPMSSPTRNYRDRSHKPELDRRAGAVRGAGRVPPRLADHRAHAGAGGVGPRPVHRPVEGQPDADGLRALFTTWITAPQPDLDVLVPAVIDGAISYMRSGAAEFAAEAKTVLELGERYPGDAGVLAAMLLNRMHLEPGEAIYLPAGNLHAYLHGVGCRGDGQLRQRVTGGSDAQARRRPRTAAGRLDFSPATEASLRPATLGTGRT